MLQKQLKDHVTEVPWAWECDLAWREKAGLIFSPAWSYSLEVKSLSIPAHLEELKIKGAKIGWYVPGALVDLTQTTNTCYCDPLRPTKNV